MSENVLVKKKKGGIEPFSKSKVEKAILKAMRTGSGIYKKRLAELIADETEAKFKKKMEVSSYDLDEYVQKALDTYGQGLTAQAYVKYRALKDYRKQDNEIVDSVMGIVHQTNKELINENANKNFRAFSTQRDLAAGEVSKLIARHIIPEHLLLAHQSGVIHIHDLDYFGGVKDKDGLQRGIFNCCLVNLEDMLTNGTVINNKKISDINSFNKACTIASQIALTVSSGQYGGQSMSISHLAPFLRLSRKRWRKIITEDNSTLSEEQIERIVDNLVKKELSDGIKTLNYQLNTFVSSNGQTPFISLFMYLNEKPEYIKETAMIIEEIFRQRIIGMPNRYGYNTVQTFPKLLYVLDENNIKEGSEYWGLTKLAAECISKTMVPDLISAKVMKEHHNGNVFPCMGCRSFLSDWKDPESGEWKYYGRFNKGVQSINLPDVALSSKGDLDSFWEILEERLELCREIGELRVMNMVKNAYNLEGSPIHWKYGALARKKDDENILDLLEGGYSTTSLGFIGMYEMCMAMLGKSNTTPEGRDFCLKVTEFMKKKTEEWNNVWNIGWSLYSTPSEGYCESSYKKTKERFGEVKDVTDHGFFSNSYHVYVAENIDAFSKLDYESAFQELSSGGAISYVEVGNLVGNQEVILEIMKHIYNNIQYAELNTECDRCNNCGSTSPLGQDKDDNFFCKECGSYNVEAVRRICGYLGVASNGINAAKRREMNERVKHI